MDLMQKNFLEKNVFLKKKIFAIANLKRDLA